MTLLDERVSASLSEREKRLEAFARAFAEAVRESREAHEARRQGGQQVPFFGDFAHVAPSTLRELGRWEREARRAVGEWVES